MESCKLNKDNWPSILGSFTAEEDCNKKKVKVFYKIEHLFLTEQIQAQLPQLPPAAGAGNALSLWVCTWCQFTQKLMFPFWSATSGTGTADSDCAAPARASCFSWAASGKPQSSSCLNYLCIKVWDVYSSTGARGLQQYQDIWKTAFEMGFFNTANKEECSV